MEELTGKWLVETVYPDLAVMLRVQQVIFSGKTNYQQVEVFVSDLFGRSLVLDGKTQSTERDEHIYHQALVHPAMLMHPDPRSVFIGGGGEGGTLREVLSHQSVERATMVDLDEQVVALCREHLPQHHQGSFSDPRLELLHQDARGYLAGAGDGFDVMVMDLVDPMEGGPAYLLYTRQYYEIAKGRLNPGGIIGYPVGPRRPGQPPGVFHHHQPHPGCDLCPLCGLPGSRPRLPNPLGIQHCIRFSTAKPAAGRS